MKLDKFARENAMTAKRIGALDALSEIDDLRERLRVSELRREKLRAALKEACHCPVPYDGMLVRCDCCGTLAEDDRAEGARDE